MSEPIYFPRPAYQAIAEALSPNDIHAGIDAAMEAHRTIAAGFIKDSDLTPRQREYVDAVRYWAKHGRMDVPAPAPLAAVAAEVSIPDDPPAPMIENPDFVSAAEEVPHAPEPVPVEKPSVFKSALRGRKKS